jgi:hypothetical protein
LIEQELGVSNSELPSIDMDAMLDRLYTLRESRVDRPTIHSIRVTQHAIPGGWTHMYRSDGHILIYVNWLVWELVPKQKYGGISLIEMRDKGWLTAIQVYKEDGCP